MNAIPPGRLQPKVRPSPAGESATGGVRLSFDDEGPEAGAPVEPPAPAPGARDGDARARRPSANGAAAASGAALPARVAAIEVTLSVELGRRAVPLRDLIEVEPGRLFPLDRLISEPVQILANGRPFARGEVVSIGERFGVRLTEIVTEDE